MHHKSKYCGPSQKRY